MSPRRAILAVAVLGAALVAAPVLSGHGARVVWNVSESVPIGLYRLEPSGRAEVGDLVAVVPPEPLAALLAERGYLPRNVPLLKRVLALPGTTVCRIGATVIVYGHAYGEARERDAQGRALPYWQSCRRIAEDEVFLMNWDAPDSFDGRYFGPLPASAITARAIPIWTDEDGDGRFRWRAADPALEP